MKKPKTTKTAKAAEPAKAATPPAPVAPPPGQTPFALAHAELVGSARKVLSEIDRLALVCDGSDQLRAALAKTEAAG